MTSFPVISKTLSPGGQVVRLDITKSTIDVFSVLVDGRLILSARVFSEALSCWLGYGSNTGASLSLYIRDYDNL